MSDVDEERTGVAEEKVLEVAKLYGDLSQRALIVFSAETADWDSPRDLSSVLEMANLLLLTGRVEGGVVGCLPVSNAQGVVDLGAVAELYPGCQEVADSEARKGWESAWGVSLPDQVGLTVLEMIKEAGSTVRGMYILGENVVCALPDAASTRQSLSDLDFLVVQDIFLTETAELADVVLPGISFAESKGTLTGVGHETRKIRKAIEPRTMPDWQTICELSSRLGFPLSYGSEEEIEKEMDTLVPACSSASSEGSGGFSFHVEEPGVVGEGYSFSPMVESGPFGYGDGAWTGRSRLSLLESVEDRVTADPEGVA